MSCTRRSHSLELVVGVHRAVQPPSLSFPHHPSLRLHTLRGRLEGLHSVLINLSYRITLEVLIEGQTLIPIDIGSHDVVYRAWKSWGDKDQAA